MNNVKPKGMAKIKVNWLHAFTRKIQIPAHSTNEYRIIESSSLCMWTHYYCNMFLHAQGGQFPSLALCCVCILGESKTLPSALYG